MTCPRCGTKTDSWPCPECGFPVTQYRRKKVMKTILRLVKRNG